MDSELVEEAGCKPVTQFYNSYTSFKMNIINTVITVIWGYNYTD